MNGVTEFQRDLLAGVVPLRARREPWMDQTLADHGMLSDLIATHGSPINLIDPSLLATHADELVDVARGRGVPLSVFFARKANKSLGLVDAALAAGHGIDVASDRELDQVLSRLPHGTRPDAAIILTAAVKPARLLERAVAGGVTICIDNTDELDLLHTIVSAAPPANPVPVVLRLQPALDGVNPSRFGQPDAELLDLIASDSDWDHLRLDGIHFHLDGYDPDERAVMIVQALALVEAARRHGHRPTYVDMGGGIPIRYLDDEMAWTQFWRRHRGADRLTWNNRELGKVYPAWQTPVRGAWLDQVLTTRVQGRTAADWLNRAGVELHCEPGRALTDGSGLTVARVEYRKQQADRTWLIGLAMNRTQCRSAADDFLVDPILVPTHEGPRSEAGEGFLVGAYCIEAELLTWRRLSFPAGVAVGDLVAFVNTGGYQMHILESASHQIPLARNLIRTDGGRWALDPIDGPVREADG